MKLFSQKDPVQAELEKMKKQEGRFLEKNRERKELFLNRFLQDKIPDRLQGTLEAAFARAFSLIFEKGTGIIEKTYRKEELEKESSIRQYAADVRGDRKSLKSFSRQAAGSGAGNTLASAAAGVGMGLLGIGIPDIPLLTGMMLRSIYETALHYGFSYDTEEEKRFILLLIQGAMTHGERLERVNDELNFFHGARQLFSGGRDGGTDSPYRRHPVRRASVYEVSPGHSHRGRRRRSRGCGVHEPHQRICKAEISPEILPGKAEKGI